MRRAVLTAVLPPGGPARRLAASTLVNTLGNGLYLTGGAIFLVRSAGLPPGQVGLGLTCAGLAGLAAGVALGDAADRLGAREVYAATLLAGAAGAALFAITHSFAVFLVAATIAAISDQGSASARGALIALIGGAEGRVELRAQLRALTNLGISFGALAAGVALAADTRAAYVAMILVDALTYLAAAAIVLGLPAFAPTRGRAADGRRLAALGDRPYVAVTAVNAVLSIHYAVLTVAIPLWISERTAAPRWIVAPLFLINTVACVALQVRASRAATTPGVAARLLRRAGVLFVGAWALIAAAGSVGATAAVVLLALGVLVHTAGELWQAGGSFELSFSLAPAEAQGQYQGVFGLGLGLSRAAGPVLSTAVCVALGAPGWIALGAVVALAGAAAPAAAGWAARTRPVATQA